MRYRHVERKTDTSCDVTIAGSALAKKHHWKIRPTELQSVKAADIEHLLIEGVASVSFAIGKRSVRHEIHITADLNELIIGSDWVAKQGKLTWDYANDKSISETATSSLWVADESESRPATCSRLDRTQKCPFVLLGNDAELLPMKESLKLLRCLI